jgi:hypothetical protein
LGHQSCRVFSFFNYQSRGAICTGARRLKPISRIILGFVRRKNKLRLRVGLPHKMTRKNLFFSFKFKDFSKLIFFRNSLTLAGNLCCLGWINNTMLSKVNRVSVVRENFDTIQEKLELEWFNSSKNILSIRKHTINSPEKV